MDLIFKNLIELTDYHIHIALITNILNLERIKNIEAQLKLRYSYKKSVHCIRMTDPSVIRDTSKDNIVSKMNSYQ